jgi:hypothetical protein
MRVEGHVNFGKVTEFSIPTPIKSESHDLSELNKATTLQNWTDVTEGKYNQGITDSVLVSSMLFVDKKGSQTTDKVYWLTTSWYQPKLNYPSLGMSDIDFTKPNAKGPWIITGEWHPNDTPSSRTSEYLLEIPQSWADDYTRGY